MRGIFLSSLSIPVLAAFAAGAAVTDTDACRSARDAALARIAAEEAAMRSMLDADAAILDAPSYYLSEAEKTLLADIEADRTRAAAAYHACLKANAVRRQSR